jgi:hypothetical protein
MKKMLSIAKKIASRQTVTLRQLLKMNIDLQITSPFDESFLIEFSGPAYLTQDGIIRWTSNGTLDTKIIIQGYQGTISSILSKE